MKRDVRFRLTVPRAFALWGFGLTLLLPWAGPARSEAPVEFRDGDLVVLLGETFIERSQSFGYLETLLTALHPDREITFRNLGWSGDTVYAHARSYFDARSFTENPEAGPPEEGFERLRAQLAELQPQVIVACYGTVPCFDGREGLPGFRQGYGRLIEMLQSAGARVTLLSPPPLENLGPPLPDQAERNRSLGVYRDVMRELAAERKAGFADLFQRMGEGRGKAGEPFYTDNGLHFSESGYARVAPVVAEALGLEIPAVEVEAQVEVGQITFVRASAREIDLAPDRVGFVLRCPTLPVSAMGGPGRLVRLHGLAPGDYTLTIDGEPILTADAAQWAHGVEVVSGPEFDQSERLRQRVIAKNQLYFHRWRPQNETYLFGFRKHEQGQNAVEIPRFDPLIRQAEAGIAELRAPAEHRWIIQPAVR